MKIKKALKKAGDFFLDLLFPPKCMFCRRLVPSAELLCCDYCLHELPEVDSSQKKKVVGFRQCIAPFYYEPPVRDALLRYKFYGYTVYAKQMSKWIAYKISVDLDGEIDLVSWVPCSVFRRNKRGFDQAQLLAEGIGKELGLPVMRTLKKKRNNKPQSRMHSIEKRRANVLGAYKAYHPEKWMNKRILLVDDIVTTGSTISECGKILLLSGADQLFCAAAAFTRLEKEKDK